MQNKLFKEHCNYPSTDANSEFMFKWGLPMNAWRHIANFLLPEENIKLSLVNSEEWHYLRTHRGQFLIPPSTNRKRISSPLWYNTQNLVLRYNSWSCCPNNLRQEYFRLVHDVKFIQISGQCAKLPITELIELFQQNATSLKKINISDFCSTPSSQFFMNFIEIPNLQDIIPISVAPVVMDKLQNLVIEGGFSLYWIFILSHFVFCSLKNITVRLPSLVHSFSLNQSKNNFRRIKKITTRFFSQFPCGKSFHLIANPKDEASRALVQCCFQWIGSGTPSSRAFSSIKLESTNLRQLLLSLNRHLSWILARYGLNAALSKDIEMFLLLISNQADETYSKKYSKDTYENGKTPFSSIRGNDKTIASPISTCLTSSKANDPSMTSTLLRGEKSTQKAIHSLTQLRSRQRNLKSVYFIGVIGPWIELLYLHGFLGNQVSFFATEFHGDLGALWTGMVLSLVSANLSTLKLEVSPRPSQEEDSLKQVTSAPSSDERESFANRLAKIPSLSFFSLTSLTLTNIVPSTSVVVSDILSRFQIHNSYRRESSDALAFSKLPDKNTQRCSISDKLNNLRNSSRSRLSFASSTQQQPLVLNLLFAEEGYISTENLKNNDALSFIKNLISKLPVTSITVCPSPHFSMFHDYHKLVRGTHYTIEPFTMGHLGSDRLQLTSDCHSCASTGIKLATPTISHITVNSSACLKWLLQVATLDERSYRFLTPTQLDVNLFIEPHIALSLMIPTFISSSLQKLNIDKCLQYIFHYVTLYDTIELFTETLDCVTLNCVLPLLLQICPLADINTLFRELKNCIECHLLELSEHYHFDVEMEFKLNKFPGDSRHPLYKYIQDAWETLLDTETLSTEPKETEVESLYEYLKYCQSQRFNLPESETQMNLEKRALEKDRFRKALGHLGVVLDSFSNSSSLSKTLTSDTRKPENESSTWEALNHITTWKSMRSRGIFEKLPLQKLQHLLRQRLQEINSNTFKNYAQHSATHNDQNAEAEEFKDLLEFQLRPSLQQLETQINNNYNTYLIANKMDGLPSEAKESRDLNVPKNVYNGRITDTPHNEENLCLDTLKFEWLPIMWVSSDTTLKKCLAALPYFNGGTLILNIRKTLLQSHATTSSSEL